MKPIVIIAVLLGIVCLGLTALYWVTPVASLPSFLPGHDPAGAGYHHKHAIGALVVAVAFFALAWFQSNTKKKA